MCKRLGWGNGQPQVVAELVRDHCRVDLALIFRYLLCGVHRLDGLHVSGIDL